jgi:predicted Zn-dependent protease
MTTIFLFDEAVAARAHEERMKVLPSVTPAAVRKKVTTRAGKEAAHILRIWTHSSRPALFGILDSATETVITLESIARMSMLRC